MEADLVEVDRVDPFWDFFVEKSIPLFINYNHNLFYLKQQLNKLSTKIQKLRYPFFVIIYLE